MTELNNTEDLKDIRKDLDKVISEKKSNKYSNIKIETLLNKAKLLLSQAETTEISDSKIASILVTLEHSKIFKRHRLQARYLIKGLKERLNKELFTDFSFINDISLCDSNSNNKNTSNNMNKIKSNRSNKKKNTKTSKTIISKVNTIDLNSSILNALSIQEENKFQIKTEYKYLREMIDLESKLNIEDKHNERKVVNSDQWKIINPNFPEKEYLDKLAGIIFNRSLNDGIYNNLNTINTSNNSNVSQFLDNYKSNNNCNPHSKKKCLNHSVNLNNISNSIGNINNISNNSNNNSSTNSTNNNNTSNHTKKSFKAIKTKKKEKERDINIAGNNNNLSQSFNINTINASMITDNTSNTNNTTNSTNTKNNIKNIFNVNKNTKSSSKNFNINNITIESFSNTNSITSPKMLNKKRNQKTSNKNITKYNNSTPIIESLSTPNKPIFFNSILDLNNKTSVISKPVNYINVSDSSKNIFLKEDNSGLIINTTSSNSALNTNSLASNFNSNEKNNNKNKSRNKSPLNKTINLVYN